MALKFLYMEDSNEARNNFVRNLQGNHQVTFASDLISLNDLLYTDRGYENFDVVLLDLSLALPADISNDDLREAIPEFKNTNVPSYLEGVSNLYGFDYFRLVINTRKETKQMVKERRVILFSGHAKRLRAKGLYTEQLYPTTRLVDRADKGAYDELIAYIYSLRK